MTEPQEPGTPTYAAPPSATPQPGTGYWSAALTPPAGQPVFAQPVAVASPAPQTPVQRVPPGHQWRPHDYSASAASVAPARQPVRALPQLPVLGLLVTSLGLLLLILSTTTLSWFGQGLFANDFGSLHDASERFSGPGFFTAYFSWLAITLLIVSSVASYATKVIRPAPALLQISALLVSLGGAAATFGAPMNGNSFHDVMTTSGAGYWCMIFGFVLVGLGAVVRI